MIIVLGRQTLFILLVPILIFLSAFMINGSLIAMLSIFIFSCTVLCYALFRLNLSIEIRNILDFIFIFVTIEFHIKYIYWIYENNYIGHFIGDAGYVVEQFNLELAYSYFSIFIALFTFISLILLKYKFFIASKLPPKNTMVLPILFYLIGILFLIIMFKFGVGRMGQQATSLPFGLSGFLFYTTQILIPYVLLREYSELNKEAKSKVIWIVFMIITYALIDSVVRSSRSTIIFIFLQLVFITSALKNVDLVTFLYRRKRFAIVIFTLILIVFYAMTIVRNIQVTTARGSNAQSVNEMVESTKQGPLEQVFNRLIGLPQLAKIISQDSNVGFFDVAEEGTAHFFTKKIVKHPATYHSSSPGLLGSSFLLFNQIGGVISAILLCLSIFVPLVVFRFFVVDKRASVVFASFIMIRTLLLLSEGTLKTTGLYLTVILFMGVFYEYLRKIYFRSV